MGAEVGQLAGDGDEEWRLGRGAVDAHDIARLHLEGVLAHDRRERFQAGGGHDAEGYPERAARTASSRRPAPYRTGSSAGSPVCSVAAAIAERASSSPRWFVFSETATTGAGRT